MNSCDILNSEGTLFNQKDEPLLTAPSEKADRNFILWSLIPYIAALSGENLMDNTIPSTKLLPFDLTVEKTSHMQDSKQ